MPGTFGSASSLTLCLAMSNAFVLPPSKGTTGNKQVSDLAPLRADDTRLGNGGALPRLSDNGVVEAGQRLPQEPWAGCYRGWGSRAICPLHMINGVQDGNTTMPVVGGVGGVGRDESGLGQGPQDEGVETASTTPAGKDGSKHGVSGDAEIATDADLATGADLQHESLDAMADDSATDEILPLDLTADGGVADKKSLILEDSFDQVVGFASREADHSRSTSDKDNPFDIASNSAFDETTLWPFDPMPLYVVESFEGDAGRSDDASTHQIVSDTNDDEMLTNVAQAIHDEIRSMLHSSDGNVFGSEWPLDLVDANGAVDGTRLGPLGPVIPDSDVHDAMTSVPKHDAVDDGTMYTLTDAMSGGVTPKIVIPDDAVNDLIRSVLNDAYAGGSSDEFILDDGMDKLMWSKLHNAISGRAASRGVTLGDALDETLTSLLHNAFFGPAASRAVSASTENACVRGLMVEDYIQVVFDLYGKFEGVRRQNTDDSALDEKRQVELGPNDVFDEPSLGQFGKLMVDEDEADSVMEPVPNDSDASSTFDEDWLFDLADDDAVNSINLWSFGPALSEDAADDEMPLVLRDAMSDGVASKAVKGLVWSVIDDAFTAGVESEGLIVDDAVDELMWSKLHDVISVSGRVASGPKNLGDVFDDVLTSLLHNALFGSTALKAIESLTKYTDDRELVVEKYVQAVSERYDELKQARGHNRNKDSPAPVGRQARKRRWIWVKKLWRKLRRKEE